MGRLGREWDQRLENEAAKQPGLGAERPAGVEQVLALQRSAGNHATAQLITRAATPNQLHRRVTKTAADLGQTGAAGRIKAVFGESTYTNIKKALTDYHGTSKSAERIGKLQAIKALIFKWLKANSGSSSKDNIRRARTLNELLIEVEDEIPAMQREADYMSSLGKGKGQPEGLEYLSKSGKAVAGQAADLAEGKTSKFEGVDEISLAEMRKYELTDAETAAIKIYTAGDYKYINPGVAGDDAWLKSGIEGVDDIDAGSKDTSPQGMSKAREEAAAHKAVLDKGLEKMDRYQGPAFRGMRRKRKDVLSQYKAGSKLDSKTYSSTSKDESISKGFAYASAKKRAEEKKQNPANDPNEEMVGLMLEITVSNGRDVSRLSAVRKEAEVLLMTDSVLYVHQLEEDPGAPDGQPAYRAVVMQIE